MHVHAAGRCVAVQLARLTQGPCKAPTGISVSLTANGCSLHITAVGRAVPYTTVLREPRLWWPTPGSASVAGVLPPWTGSGGTSRALLLSAESSRSARGAPAVGTGCSGSRGRAPSPPPAPGGGGLASAGSKASSSAGDKRAVSRVVGLVGGMLPLMAGQGRPGSPLPCATGRAERASHGAVRAC